jgi:hypothetical protein
LRVLFGDLFMKGWRWVVRTLLRSVEGFHSRLVVLMLVKDNTLDLNPHVLYNLGITFSLSDAHT